MLTNVIKLNLKGFDFNFEGFPLMFAEAAEFFKAFFKFYCLIPDPTNQNILKIVQNKF